MPTIKIEMTIQHGDSISETVGRNPGPHTSAKVTAELANGQILITGKNLALTRVEGTNDWVVQFS